jgi:hypothetical protein
VDINKRSVGSALRRFSSSTPAVALAIGLWLAALGTGFSFLWAYKSKPGQVSTQHPVEWPRGSSLVRDSARHTLVMFAHPRCPCTQASVSELARLMTELHGRMAAYVVVVKLQGLDEGWELASLGQRASVIPGVTVVRDPEGQEAARFGALTSGLALVYDSGGALEFAGGITASRGHEGDSFGKRRIVSLVTTGTADRRQSPVFGCALGHAGPSVASQ